MTQLVANSQFDMDTFIANADLQSLFEFAEVLVHTETIFQIMDVEDTQEVLTLTGIFGGYDGGEYPTTGTITGGSYEPGNTGNPAFSFSNTSVTVAAFTAFITANDVAGLFEALLSGNDQVAGSSLGDLLRGFTGADTLDGGAGADTLYGGLGNDSFIVDNAADLAVEFADEGQDTVLSTINWTLGANLENLTLTGSAIEGTGNSLANVIIGNSANNVLNGGAGADTMLGGAGNDSYYVDNVGDQASEAANGGTDTVYSSVNFVLWSDVENLTLTGTAISAGGNAGNNTIIGNAQNNALNGDLGADLMIGGAGNDSYYVDNAGDRASEGANGGTDWVYSSVSFTLWTDIENLTLTGTAVTAIGNASDNTIIGNAQNNALNGDLGADLMIGGAGNDSYYVDNAGDRASEGANGGADWVYSSVSFTLWTDIENLTLTGTAVTAIGNASDNTIIGNAQNNVLNGDGGADLMIGGAGNDSYYVDNVGDRASEGADGGTDWVYSSVSFTLWSDVENLTLTGTGVINGTGNAQNNRIFGNSGANLLNGSSGNDTLQGGAGADSFLFDSILNVSTNVDRIIDFSVADDTIVLDDDIFAALSLGTLGASAFHTGTTAQDADDRIIYDSAAGNVYYDADGNGAGTAILFAQVNAGTALTSADFLVVA